MTKTNETADTRTMATDAVATIGMLIPEHAGRDAIHLAVEPVVAGERLAPGQHIGFLPDGTVGTKATELLGIVDPFLAAALFPGDRFWLVVYPRTITSLRHVWAHPAFAPAEIGLARQEAAPTDEKAVAEAWIKDFADKIDQTVPRLMAAAEKWLQEKDYTYDNSEAYKDHWDSFEEFWVKYAVVTGADVPENDRATFFTCSC